MKRLLITLMFACCLSGCYQNETNSQTKLSHDKTIVGTWVCSEYAEDGVKYYKGDPVGRKYSFNSDGTGSMIEDGVKDYFKWSLNDEKSKLRMETLGSSQHDQIQVVAIKNLSKDKIVLGSSDGGFEAVIERWD